MKKMLLTISLLGFSASYAQDEDKMVYGSDGRKEVYESNYEKWAESTAVMISKDIVKKEGEQFKIKGPKLSEEMAVCPSERFSDQPVISDCSGFLVAPDLLVTAGHCMQDKNACQRNFWIFDFHLTGPGQVNTTFKADQIYSCKEIVAFENNKKTLMDFAIVRLDRSTGRTALKFRTSGQVPKNADLVVIGSPTGLPTKITEGGTLRTNDNPLFFVANLDTFSGNSGSIVIDANTELIEGILVRGDRDYSFDQKRGCSILLQCAEGSCRGEDVTRITGLLKWITP